MTRETVMPILGRSFLADDADDVEVIRIGDTSALLEPSFLCVPSVKSKRGANRPDTSLHPRRDQELLIPPSHQAGSRSDSDDAP